MGKVVRIPAGNTTNVHYNFVVAKPLVTIKRNGKLCHSFHSNDYVYRRKEVKASGVAYFVCTVDKCPMWLHARYKEAANTDEEPTLLL